MIRVDSADVPQFLTSREHTLVKDDEPPKLEGLLAQAPGLLWRTNRDLMITEAQGAEAVSRLLDSLHHRPLGEVFPEGGPHSVLAAHESALLGQSRPFEFRRERRTFFGRAEPVYDCFENVIGTAAMALDVTERHTADKIKAQAREAEKVQALKRFAGGIAHNFNNLLTVILGYAHLAKNELSERDASCRYLGEIQSAAQCLADLIGAVTCFGQKQSGLMAPVSLTALVESSKNAVALLVPAHIEVRYNLGEVPGRIEGDLEQLQKVLMVLVANASEAIGAASGTILISTDVVDADRLFLAGLNYSDDAPEGRYVRLRVADSGVGIDEESREHLLEPFYSTKFTGRGMGLAAAQGMVAAHGGTLAFASIPGLGTTFHVLFPCQADSGAGQSRGARGA